MEVAFQEPKEHIIVLIREEEAVPLLKLPVELLGQEEQLELVMQVHLVWEVILILVKHQAAAAAVAGTAVVAALTELNVLALEVAVLDLFGLRPMQLTILQAVCLPLPTILRMLKP